MTDYKFDIDGKKLSSKDIQAKKDFDSFLQGIQVQGKAFYQKSWFWTSTGLASAAVAMIIMFSGNENQNSITENSANPKNEVTSSKLETSFINPPFEGLRVEGDVFKVDANKGGIFKSRHGSIIKIPALAFFNRKGKTIKDQTVDVEFTEYKDVADQLISGIPMTYDSAGTKYMFSSAGMIEIRGYIGDSAVALNPEKPIEVEMQSENTSNEYNFYCLNEKEKKWDYRGKDSIGDPEDGKLSDKELQTQFPEIKESDIVIPNNLVETELQKVPEYHKRKKKRIAIQTEIDDLRQITPAKPTKGDDDAKKFSLDIIEKENPELMPYKDVQFQLAEGEVINPQHTSQNWNKVNIIKTEGNEVIITFSKTNSHQKIQYEAIPVLTGEAFEEAHKTYMDHASKIKSRRSELASIEKQIKFMKKRAKEGSVKKALVKAQLERLERIATIEKTQFENRKTTEKVTRFFTTSNFGVFNCDKAVEMGPIRTPLITDIKFRKEVNETVVFHVFKRSNGIYKAMVIKDQSFKEYANVTTVIGISQNKLGIMHPISRNGKMDFMVKGKPKTKGELVSWLEF